jgi:hypothetical protein
VWRRTRKGKMVMIQRAIGSSVCLQEARPNAALRVGHGREATPFLRLALVQDSEFLLLQGGLLA